MTARQRMKQLEFCLGFYSLLADEYLALDLSQR